MKRHIVIAIIVILILLFMGAGVGVGFAIYSNHATPTEQKPQTFEMDVKGSITN